MKTLITICARSGSKGIPGKNIKRINGIPLIAYTVKIAQEFSRQYSSQLALSTDSKEIKKVCSDYGLKTEYIRDNELAGDSIGKIDVLKDLLNWHEKNDQWKYDYILDLDVTSPLRTLTDLNNALRIIEENKNAINLFSVSPASRNPYFNMVEQKDNGFYDIVKKLKKDYLTRQTAPKVYDMNASFYFYRRQFFEMEYKSAITPNSLIYEVPHICFDLDHPVDFDFLSYLIKNNKLDFEL